MTSARTGSNTGSNKGNFVKAGAIAVTALAAVGCVSRQHDAPTDLPNRIPEAAPYLTSEAQVFPPPYEEYWATQNHAGQCASCHKRIFDEWNGSMMSNSWRDPGRGAGLLSPARAGANQRGGGPAAP